MKFSRASVAEALTAAVSRLSRNATKLPELTPARPYSRYNSWRMARRRARTRTSLSLLKKIL